MVTAITETVRTFEPRCRGVAYRVEMARNLILGHYNCTLDHKHSTNEEMMDCNRIEEERRKQEHSLAVENLENERIQMLSDMKSQEIEHDKEKMKHKEKMAELELERMRTENDRQPPKSRVCTIS